MWLTVALMALSVLQSAPPCEDCEPPVRCDISAWVEPPDIVRAEYLTLKGCGWPDPPFFCCDELCNDQQCTATPIEDGFAAKIEGKHGWHLINARSAGGGGHHFVWIFLE